MIYKLLTYKNTFIPKLLLVVWFSSIIYTSKSQTLTVNANKANIKIGEVVEVSFQLKEVDAATMKIKEWKNLPDSFNNLEILQTFPKDSFSEKRLLKIIQKYQLTSYEEGSWQIPAMQIVVHQNNQLKTLQTTPLLIDVSKVDVKNLSDFHDIKDVEEVTLKERDFQQYLYLFIATVVLFFIWLIWVRRKKETVFSKEDSIKNPLLIALKALDELDQKKLWQQQHKLFYSNLIQICKQFTDDVLHQKTKAYTAEEYMLKLKGRTGIEAVETQFFQLLRLANIVQFAQYIPDETMNKKAVETAKKFVNTFAEFNLR